MFKTSSMKCHKMISPPLSSFARPRCFFLLSPFCSSSLRRLCLPHRDRPRFHQSHTVSDDALPPLHTTSHRSFFSSIVIHPNLRVPSLGLARAAVRATSGNRAAWSRHVVLYNSRSRVLRVHRLSLNMIEGGGGQTSAVRTITPTHFYRSRRRQTTIHARSDTSGPYLDFGEDGPGALQKYLLHVVAGEGGCFQEH